MFAYLRGTHNLIAYIKRQEQLEKDIKQIMYVKLISVTLY